MGRQYGSGEGSIYKYKSGWRGQITLGGKRFSHSAKTKKEVADWIAAKRVEYNHGVLVAPQNITVEEFAKIWLDRKEKVVSPQTIYKMEKMFETHLYPTLGKESIQKLTREQIESAYQIMFQAKTKNGRRYCDSTVKLFAARFKSMLNYAVESNILIRNPHTGVVLPRYESPSKVEAFTQEEQIKIVEYLLTSNNKMDRLYYILLSTGMRLGEAIALTWNDVDLERGTININKTAVNYKGHMTVQSHPKTRQSVRTIYMSERLIQFLRGIKQEEVMSKERLVVPNTNNKLIHTSSARSRWVRACAEIGISYRGIHSLRHSWATRALESGIDVKTVSKMLGHTSVVTTMNIYQDALAEQQQKAAKLLNKFI